MNEVANIREELNGEMSAYCSMTAETKEDKIKLYNAVNNTEDTVAKHINEVIEIKDIYCEMTEITDKETGEITLLPRTVLIDSEGKGYNAVAKGVFNSVKQILALFGDPKGWTEPLKVKVRQKATAKGNTNYLEIVK